MDEANRRSLPEPVICRVDAAGNLDSCSPSFARVLGRSAAELAGQPLRALLGEGSTTAARPIVLDGRTWRATEAPLLGPGGEPDGSVVALLPEPDHRAPPAGASTDPSSPGGPLASTAPSTPAALEEAEQERRKALKLAEEATAAEHAARFRVEETQRRLAFLVDATTALFVDPRDPRQTLEQLSQLLVPQLADWCFVDLAGKDGRLDLVERVAAAHWNPAHAALAESMTRSLKLHPDSGVGRVLRSGEPRRIQAPPDPGEGGEDFEQLARIGAQSAIIVPLGQHGGPRAAVTLAFSETTRRYHREDVDLAQDLAARASMALRNGLLFQERERAIKAREDTLSIVSHDLRGPLSALTLQAHRLTRLLPADDHRASQALQILQRMENTLRGMDGLIGNLLDVARIEEGGLHLDYQPCSVAAVVESAAAPYETLAVQKSVRLTLELAPGLSEVWGDPVRLAQVISNLTANALKFTPEGGTIRVRAEPAGDAVHFSVIDSGRGIAPDALPSIFRRFWQPREEARKGGGLGLGLFIVRGIVEAHGGRVWVESEPGRGSHFQFTIPTARARAALSQGQGQERI